MKKTFLLKTMLLLCALIFGGNAWADTHTQTYTFTSTTPTGWTSTAMTSGTSNYAKMKSGEYVEAAIGTLVADGSIISSALNVNVSAGTFGTWTGTKQVTVTVSFLNSSNQVLSSSNYTKTDLGNSEATYIASDYPITVSLPDNPSAIAKVRVAFTIPNSSDVLRFKYLKLNYSTASTNPNIIANNVSYAPDITSGEIAYTIENPVEGKTMNATTATSWISNVSVDAINKKVSFSMTENEATTAREGTITLNYGNGIATKDVKVTQTAAVAKYTVTIETPTGGTLVVKRNGIAINSGDRIPTSTQLTIEATPNSGYKFKNWVATDASTHTYTTTFTYTIGSSDVTIKANFDEIITHTITWSVNGVTSDETVEQGEAISFTAPTAGIPTGFSFVGWTESEIALMQNTPPSFTYSANCTVDKTYYAVFAFVDGNGTETARLTANSDWSGYVDKEFTDNKNNTWTGKCAGTKSGNNYFIGLKSTDGAYLQSPTFPGYITAISVNAINSSGSDRTIFISSSSNATAGNLGSIMITKSTSTAAVFNASLTTGLFKSFYMTVSGALSINYISVTYSTATYSNFCTSVPETLTATITAAGWATYAPAYPVSFRSGTKAYIVEVADDEEAVLTLVQNVPAGTPVLLEGAAGTHTMDVVATSATDVTDNCLFVSNGTNPAEDMYVLANINNVVGFYLWDKTNGGNLPAGKIYMKPNLTDARPFIALPGEETEINNVSRETTTNNRYFDLQGRRVMQPTKGLYIVNGKKVIIK